MYYCFKEKHCLEKYFKNFPLSDETIGNLIEEISNSYEKTSRLYANTKQTEFTVKYKPTGLDKESHNLIKLI